VQVAQAIYNRIDALIVATTVTMRIMITNAGGRMKRLVDVTCVVDDKSQCK